MRQPDLRSFLHRLREAGELVEVGAEVDTDLEMAALADRVSRCAWPRPGSRIDPAANKALLFTRVKDSPFPVLMNALGSERRMNLVCGVRQRAELEGLVGGLLHELERPRRAWRDKLAALPLLLRLARLFPRPRPTGPCQDVVHEGDDVDLFELPILRTWPLDAGPFITLGLVFTKDPVSGARNCGLYRLQRYDERTLGFHVHAHHTGAEHLRRAAALGRTHLEVAVAVGAAPAVTFSAVAPLPPGVDEMLFAALLQGAPVEMVPCRTVGLEVPATAEFVIEGVVPVDERRTEGPFGDHTGFYSLPDEYGVLHVSAVTHRKDAIWQATVVGPPPQEDCWMGAAIERLFLPLQRKILPEVLDMRLPFAGVFHNLMLLRIRKEYPGQARKAAHSVWGMGQAMFTKVVVVVDEEAPELADDAGLLELLLARLDVSRDLEFVLGPTETLDHASRALHFGSKVSVDLTREFPGEGARRGEPSGLPPDAEEVAAACRRLPGVTDAVVLGMGAVAVCVEKVRPSVPRVTIEQVWDLGARRGWSALTDRVLVLDQGQRLDDPARLLWLCLAHIDPERDLARSGHVAPDASLREQPHWHPRRLGVDATSKNALDGFARPWPTEQLHPPEVLRRVAQLWKELGLPGEMP